MNTKLFFLAIISGVFVGQLSAAKLKISLQTALQKKYISSKVLCKGGLELNYSVKNLTKDSMIIVIPAGWRFNSADVKNDYQDILITKPEILALKANELKSFYIFGYCCELTKAGPKLGIAYTVGQLADSNLVKLARYLSINPIDKNTQQAAVWTISDNEETANITHLNDSMAEQLRRYVAIIKGEPLPWYTLLKQARVNSYGEIFNIPVKFAATLFISVNESCYSYAYILDDNGQKVSEIFGKWINPDYANYESKFNVKGFKKGNYTLVIESKGNKLVEKAFKI